MKTSPYFLSVALLLVVNIGTAHAEAGHHPHYPYLGGLKGVAVAHVEHGETGTGGGVGAFIERALLEDIVDAEVSVAYAHVGEEDIVPVDVLIKTPFFATHEFTLYAGAGASLTYEQGPEETHFRPGVAGQVGVYLWPWEHYGIDVEFDYNLLLAPEIGHEMNVAAGPIMRF